MQIAKQLLEVLIFAKSLGLSHCRLDSDCIHVKHLDFRNDKIEILVHGFEKVHLETLGVNIEVENAPESKVENVNSLLHNFSSKSERKTDGGVGSDLMSIGIIIFMLIIGLAPFQGKSSRKLLDAARLGYISFNHNHWRLVSPEAKEFVKRITDRQICNDNSFK